MRVYIRCCLALVLILSVLMMAGDPATAEAEDSPVGYSVNAILPDNQLNAKVTYFDLRVKPGQEQNLQIELHNHEKEELTVRLAAHNASTNSNGLVVYEEGETDPSMAHPLADLISFEEEEVTVGAGETKTVTAALKVPEKEFDGVILGGLYMEKVMDESGESEGVQISNRYAYLIGVQLSESDEAVRPELKLGRVTPGLVNYRTAVSVGLRNVSPVLLSGVTVDAKVTDKKGETIREKQQPDVRMAPNSKMDVVIDWENRPLDPGDYELALTARMGDQEWAWTEPFTIERAEARKANRDAVEIEKDPVRVWLYAVLAALVVLVVVLLGYIRRLKAKSGSASSGEKED